MFSVTTKTALYYLHPYKAESLVKYSNNIGNFALHGIARGFQAGRNTFYSGVALATISGVGATFGLMSGPAAVGLAGVGIGICAQGFKRMFDSSNLLTIFINQPRQLNPAFIQALHGEEDGAEENLDPPQVLQNQEEIEGQPQPEGEGEIPEADVEGM